MRWGLLLIAICGAGLIGAGFFTADPVRGFPHGTPASAVAVSWHGLLHLVCAAVGFLALISACAVCAPVRLAGPEAAFSAGAGGFWFALALVWSWLSAISIRLRVEAAHAQGRICEVRLIAEGAAYRALLCAGSSGTPNLRYSSPHRPVNGDARLVALASNT